MAGVPQHPSSVQDGYAAGPAPPVHSTNQSAEFFLSNYRLGRTLGIGSFGKVSRGGRGRGAGLGGRTAHRRYAPPAMRRWEGALQRLHSRDGGVNLGEGARQRIHSHRSGGAQGGGDAGACKTGCGCACRPRAACGRACAPAARLPCSAGDWRSNRPPSPAAATCRASSSAAACPLHARLHGRSRLAACPQHQRSWERPLHCPPAFSMQPHATSHAQAALGRRAGTHMHPGTSWRSMRCPGSMAYHPVPCDTLLWWKNMTPTPTPTHYPPLM